MNRTAILKGLLLVVAGIALWACMTWPLALHFRSAIAYTPRRAGNVPEVHALMPSDNIQLMYHFWLCRDMIAGKTPAFSNIYEFNTGDDASMRRFSPYYVPFSLIYAVVSPVAGNAAGWNSAFLISALLGFIGLFALARRFSRSFFPAFATAFVAGAFPYIWINAIIGSPTGFAMCLVPWLLHGLDDAIRRHSAVGGLIAGFAFLAAFCTDLHVFYFVALAAPPWALLLFLIDGNGRADMVARAKRAIPALIPFAILALAAVFMAKGAGGDLKETTMSAGRTMQEVRNCSPILRGLFSWRHLGNTNLIYAGTGLVALLAFAVVSYFPRIVSRDRDWRKITLFAAVLMAIGAVVLLANGAYGPFGGLPIRIARKFIPKYTMIRQSAKVFCLMPSLIVVLLSVSLAAMKGRVATCIASLLAVAALAEQATWLRPALCTTPGVLPAYRAAADYAAANGIDRPHALCVPLWPGEAHYSSLYEYGVIGTRIRMVNGYSPSVPAGYFENVFSKLESLNGGVMTEEQRSLLCGMGVNLILFHEQPYPQKVSPFTSQIALEKLRANPALREVAAADGVFVFALTGAAAEGGTTTGDMLHYPAAMHWRASRLLPVGGKNGSAGAMRPIMRSPVHFSNGVKYMMLLSGGGTLEGALGTVVEVPERAEWVSVPFIPPIGERFTIVSGNPVMRHALITAGEPTSFGPGSKYTWRACEFFHQGYSDESDGSVTFDQTRNYADVLLFGPDLPFPKGRYRATIKGDFQSGDVFSAETIGDGGTHLASSAIDASAGECAISFNHDGMLPLRLSYRFRGSGAVRVRTITIER